MCLWKTPKISTTSLTARDLVPSTEANEPSSPVLGGSTEWSKKKTGVKELQITNNNNSSNVNTYQGGWNI